jgi:hypothetical protein
LLKHFCFLWLSVIGVRMGDGETGKEQSKAFAGSRKRDGAMAESDGHMELLEEVSGWRRLAEKKAQKKLMLGR